MKDLSLLDSKRFNTLSKKQLDSINGGKSRYKTVGGRIDGCASLTTYQYQEGNFWKGYTNVGPPIEHVTDQVSAC